MALRIPAALVLLCFVKKTMGIIGKHMASMLQILIESAIKRWTTNLFVVSSE
jgi:hypothetical protein